MPQSELESVDAEAILRDAKGTSGSDSLHALRMHRVAVLIPCCNEELTVESVINGFRHAVPSASIYVYDNNSTDKTVEAAQAAGAIVRREPLQGKGNVVRRMFADVDADVYVLVDGDATYDASSAPRMIDTLVDGQLDMVNGARVTVAPGAYRAGHRLGNLALTKLVAIIFGDRFSDMLSGYRVLSRRFVKSFPVLSSGFEIETELTVHALELRMPSAEVQTPYKERPAGSASKLRTIRDGVRIVRTIFLLVKEERPLAFFLWIGAALALASLILSVPVFITYLETGLVPRFPTAILATGLMLLAALSGVCGLVLDGVARGRKEIKRMLYLQIPIVGKAA